MSVGGIYLKHCFQAHYEVVLSVDSQGMIQSENDNSESESTVNVLTCDKTDKCSESGSDLDIQNNEVYYTVDEDSVDEGQFMTSGDELESNCKPRVLDSLYEVNLMEANNVISLFSTDLSKSFTHI